MSGTEVQLCYGVLIPEGVYIPWEQEGVDKWWGKNPLSIWVKIADISDNTRPERLMVLDDRTKERLTAKYIWALDYLYRDQVKGSTHPVQT